MRCAAHQRAALTAGIRARFTETVRASGLSKHGEIRAMLMERFGLGRGAAYAVVHLALRSGG